MHPCCESTEPANPAAGAGTLTIALAGNPNSGKTTIFNALTGLRQKVANYPGVTVEKKTGKCKLPDGRRANVIDLPGTYSLTLIVNDGCTSMWRNAGSSVPISVNVSFCEATSRSNWAPFA